LAHSACGNLCSRFLIGVRGKCVSSKRKTLKQVQGDKKIGALRECLPTPLKLIDPEIKPGVMRAREKFRVTKKEN